MDQNGPPPAWEVPHCKTGWRMACEGSAGSIPLKRKMVCPELDLGADGTFHVVLNEVTGFPISFCQKASAIHPLPNPGTCPGRNFGATSSTRLPVARFLN